MDQALARTAALAAVSCTLACQPSPSPSPASSPPPTAEALSEVPDPPIAEDGAPPEPSISCDLELSAVSKRALERQAGRSLPVQFTVDSDAGVHLEYSADTLDLETAALLASWPGPGWARSLHLELNAVRKLDVAVAEALAKWTTPGLDFDLHLELDGLRSINPKAAQALSQWQGAQPLAEFGIEWDYYQPSSSLRLALNGLRTLEAPVARALVVRWQVSRLGSRKRLELDGVVNIKDDGLRFLAPARGDLHLTLNGLSALTPAEAERITAWPSAQLELSGVQTLDGASAARFAAWSGAVLDLSGLTALDAQVALELALFRGTGLHLDGLSGLDPGSARALARWRGRALTLDGVTQLDVQTATALASWNLRDLHAEREIERRTPPSPTHPVAAEEEPELTGADRVAADIAALYDRDLSLRSLDSPPAGVSAALDPWHGPRKIALAGDPVDALSPGYGDDDDFEARDVCALTTLDEGRVRGLLEAMKQGPRSEPEPEPESHAEADANAAVLAAAFAPWHPLDPALLLPSPLSPEDARLLGAFRVRDELRVTLEARAGIDHELIAGLNRANHEELVIVGSKTLDRAVAEALAAWTGGSLRLDEVSALNPEAAEALAAWTGSELTLNGLARLDLRSAAALATWTGDKLELDGVQGLDAQTARALAAWGGSKLELDGVQGLDAQTARALAAWGGDKLELDGLATLAPAVAAALVTFGGEELELDGLAYFSEATARALLAGTPSVSWDGRPISFSTTTGGVVVPKAMSPATIAAMRVPPNSWSMHWADSLRSVGEGLSSRRARDLATLTDVRTLDLDSLETLPPRSAQGLAAWPGAELLLGGLSELPEASARALAAWPGERLDLGGLTTLGAQSAQALAAWTGQDLILRGLRALDPAAAEALLRSKGERVSLDPYLLLSKAAAAGLRGASHVAVEGDDRSFEYLSLEVQL